MIAFKKKEKDKLFFKNITIFKNKIVIFSIILFFIIVFSSFEQISSAAINSHVSSAHTTIKSDSSHSDLKGKNAKQQSSDSSNNNEKPWSNAFNFKKSLETTVDPRTGILMVHLKVGGLLSNIGHGPNINLQINYNSNTFSDPDGIGRGWSWNLTHFNLKTDQLTTSGGQSFWLHRTRKNHWQPLYHKLYDIKINGDKSEYFTITYANGLREILSHDGYETRLEQQSGWGVNFVYHKGTHLLQSVVDDEGNKISIDRSQGYLDIISHKSDGKPAIIRIENRNNRPDEMIFLSGHQFENPAVHLHYKSRFLTHVVYPSGLVKKFTFNCNDAMKMPVSLSGHFHYLCVVTAEESDPGFGQPVMKTRYSYAHANINGHNYLGFNSGLTTVINNKRDILFESPADYSYRTITDNGLTKEVHTYNKYHLLIDDKLVSDHTGRTLSETQSFFCNTKIADGCSQSSFIDLPVTYSLPLKIVTQVWGSSDRPPATFTVTKAYNSCGQIVHSKDAYGRVTVTHYCSLIGDNACPAQPHSWFFNVLPKIVTFYPAPDAINRQPLQTKTVYNFYRKQNNLRNSGYILKLDHQVYKFGHQSVTIYRNYYKDRSNILTYGLLNQTVLTDTTTNSPHAIIHDYSYSQDSKNHTLTTNTSVELNPGKWQQLSSAVTSLFTGQVLEKTSNGGLKRRDYYYDAMNRLTRTDLDKGTAFAATLHYQYVISPGHSYFIATRVNGLQQKIVFDNAGRELMRFNERLSPSGEAMPGHWQLKKALSYDSYGRVTEQKHYVSGATGKAYVLKITKAYDELGRITHINLPDGETIFRLYDNPDRCMISYQQSSQGERSPVYIVQDNLLNKPIKKRILPASSTSLPSAESMCSFKKMAQDAAKTETITYDGWGRPVMTEDVMGRIVHKHYDQLGHLDDITDPVGNHIHFVYNLIGKMTERWALPAKGGHYLLSSAGYNNASQLMYKAGEDGKRTTFTYTKAGQLSTAITSGGHRFSWKYNPVGLPVAKYTDGELSLQTDYDYNTDKPIKKQDITGITTWKYSIDGLIEQEKHIGTNSYPDYQLSKYYDSERRIIGSTDIENNMTYVKYDKLGRITAISYQPEQRNTQTLYTQDYDAFSRISAIHYGSGMQRIIRYDNWDHKRDVTDTLNRQLLFRWQFGYSPDNNIVILHRQTENHQEAVLNYQYDQLDNLVSMHCDGSSGLPLCPRDTAFTGSGLSKAPVITSQHYTFTPLNRLAQIKEILQDTATQQTLNKTVAYYYNNVQVPLRLQQTETQWNQQAPVIQHLYYDNTGNMTTDGEGNHITYNIFSQITRVVKPDGEQSQYVYDGSGLERLEENASGHHYLFYSGNKLINEKISNTANESHVIGYYGVARTLDGLLNEYTEQNYKQDIVGILTKATKDNGHTYQLTQRNVYSPYGMVWHNQSLPAVLSSRNFFGFDGQRTDPATGWQFLGSGHRTYNPQQRYFVSEDPAGDGYAFASNNPIMKTDPSGNMSKSFKKAVKVMQDIFTFGLGAIKGSAGDFLRIPGMILMTMLTGGAIGISCLACGLPTIAAFSILPVSINFFLYAGAIISDNDELNAVVAITGTLQIAVAVFATISMIQQVYSYCLTTAELISGEFASESSLVDSMSETAALTGEGSPPSYQSLGLNNAAQSMAQLENRQLNMEMKTFSSDIADSQSVSNPSQLHGSDHISRGVIMANSAAALHENLESDVSVVDGFIEARPDFPSAAYRDSFRETMASLGIKSTNAENSTVSLNDLFPSTENGAAIVVGRDDISLIEVESGKFFPYMISNRTLNSPPYSYDEVMQPFHDSEGKLFVYEYYRIR